MPDVNLHESLLLAYSTKNEGNMDDRFSDRSVVMQNRRKLYNQFGINPRFAVEAKQVHESRVLALDSENISMWYGMNIPGIDGFATNQTNVVMVTKFADCVPVVLFDPENKAVATIHAGWQGTVKKIQDKGLQMLIDNYNSDPSKVLVWLGPCAQKDHYVSSERPQQLDDEAWSDFITQEKDGWHIDLPGFIKQSLKNMGVKAKNITDDGRCTVESEEFFSHIRTQNGKDGEGRFMVIAQVK